MLLQQTAVQSSILFLYCTGDRILHSCYSNRQLLSPPSYFSPTQLILQTCSVVKDSAATAAPPAFCWKYKNDETASRAQVDQQNPAPRPWGWGWGWGLGPRGRFLLTHPRSAGRYITVHPVSESPGITTNMTERRRGGRQSLLSLGPGH